jgi:hypothetical protein
VGRQERASATIARARARQPSEIWVRATIKCSYRPRAINQASPSQPCCTWPGSILGRSPIRAELLPVGPSGSSRQVCSMTLIIPAAASRPWGLGIACSSSPPEQAPTSRACCRSSPNPSALCAER